MLLESKKVDFEMKVWMDLLAVALDGFRLCTELFGFGSNVSDAMQLARFTWPVLVFPD